MRALKNGRLRPLRGLNSTLKRLAALQQDLPGAQEDDSRLKPLERFGSNPGALRALTYIPAQLRAEAPLVVVLHGCTQNASGYNRGSGWSKLADEQGFALLFPEQVRGNNANLCFNWFQPADAARGGGETLSIRQMVAAMIAMHGIDPDRVFVNGLSAGGAMTAVMLNAYPEVFAGGAVIAGLPAGAAHSLPQALERMRGQGIASGEALAARTRAASNHQGPWPTLSVWHGSADAIVSPSNATALIDQWRRLHGAPEAPSRSERIAGYPHHIWRGADGRDVVESYSITGMQHGTPIDSRGPAGCGAAMPHMLEAGICSTRQIARFWGICDGAEVGRVVRIEEPEPTSDASDEPARSPAATVQRTIEEALRSAGLMR